MNKEADVRRSGQMRQGNRELGLRNEARAWRTPRAFLNTCTPGIAWLESLATQSETESRVS